ncbi:MAG: serine acetyltransferase [Ruminococcaceae bacterium]|nr:serine acetyltransferase [Oscillospiraceae bacterium]
MIQSRADLSEYLQADENYLVPDGFKQTLIAGITCFPAVSIKKYLTFLRKQEYYINTANGSKLKKLLALYYERRKNSLGLRLGIEIAPNCFGKGLCIYHAGNIVVNDSVRAGENCKLHGSNCIGNNGITQHAPRLGDNVDIGFGAVVIGDIEIADGTVIGANAVVNRSVREAGCTVVGVPAAPIHR